MNNTLKIVSASLLGVALVAGGLANFLPWKEFSFSFGGAELEMEFGLWGFGGSANGAITGSGAESESASWYDEEGDDKDGVGLIRTAIPIFGVGLLVGLVGLVVVALGKRVGGILGITGGALTLLATILWMVGFDQGMDEDMPFSLDTGFGLYFAFAAVAFAIAGGIVALLPSRAPAGYPGAVPYPAGAGAYGQQPGYAPPAYAQPAYGAPAASAAPPAGSRRVKCPKCSTVVTVAAGARPRCTACGFGA